MYHSTALVEAVKSLAPSAPLNVKGHSYNTVSIVPEASLKSGALSIKVYGALPIPRIAKCYVWYQLSVNGV